LEEFSANTDPRDAHSFVSIFVIEEVAVETRVSIEKTSVARSYRLYRSKDLGVLDGWTSIAGPLLGNGGILVLDDPAEVSTGSSYRVGIELP